MQPNRTSDSNLAKKEALEWNFKKTILKAFLGLLIMIRIYHSGATEITYKYG